MKMNQYITEEIKQKWCNYEFIGKPMTLRNGKTYMRAKSKTFDHTHFYCFEEDFMWWDKNDILSV